MDREAPGRPEPQALPAPAPAAAAGGGLGLALAAAPERVLALQRTAGNQATTRYLLRAGAGQAVAPAAPASGPQGAADNGLEPGWGTWHVQLDPGSGVVSAGTTVTVRLRNLERFRGHLARVRVSARGPKGSGWSGGMSSYPARLDIPAHGYEASFDVTEPGPWQVVVTAQPTDLGPELVAADSAGRSPGRLPAPLRLTAQLDVVSSPSATDSAGGGRPPLGTRRR